MKIAVNICVAPDGSGRRITRRQFGFRGTIANEPASRRLDDPRVSLRSNRCKDLDPLITQKKRAVATKQVGLGLPVQKTNGIGQIAAT